MKKGDVVVCNTVFFQSFTQGKEYVIENTYLLNNIDTLELTNDDGGVFYLPHFYFDLTERDNYGPKARKNLMRTLFNRQFL